MSDSEKSKAKPLRRILLILGGSGLLAMVGVSCASRIPPDLGIVNGKLQPPPSTPNCVCSEYPDNQAYVEPLAYQGNDEQAWQRLKDVVADQGGELQEEQGSYCHYTFTSLIFRFIDDIEFRQDVEAKVIHVRSASRVGRSDLGVNRRRVETIRKSFSQ